MSRPKNSSTAICAAGKTLRFLAIESVSPDEEVSDEFVVCPDEATVVCALNVTVLAVEAVVAIVASKEEFPLWRLIVFADAA